MLSSLDSSVEQVKKTAKKMAKRFCEDEDKFKMDDCLKIFLKFCNNIAKCQKVLSLFN